MRLLHISDLHIGIKLYNRDLSSDQEYVFGQIIEYVKKYTPDVIIIAGDIYDKSAPSAEAVQLFNSFLEKLYNASDSSQIMMISGNHDSAQRIDYLSWILGKQRLHISGVPPKSPDEHIKKITLNDEHGEINFYLLPFSKPSMLKGVFDTDSDNTYSYNEALHKLFEHEIRAGYLDPDKRNVLISHQFYLPIGQDASKVERSEAEISAVGNIDVVSNDVLTPFDYAALGHIHKPMTVGEDRFRYSGTPLAYSISEANQEKGTLLIDIGEKGNTKIEKLPLVPLHKIVTIEDNFENVLKQPTDDYVQIILTDKDDLDVVDLKERLNLAFPNLLEIQRKYTRGLDVSSGENIEIKNISPYDLICEFIPDMDDEEREIMKSVINEAMEVDE